MSELKTRISDATKDAMKARDKDRVAALRMINAELKRVEVDERKMLSDDDVLTILNRMRKQRQDSLKQFEDAGRDDLAATERFELALLETFMPAPLAEAEIDALVDEAIAGTGASGMADMGKVMGRVKGAVGAGADMGVVSARVKAKLSAT
ncbi:MAG: GatB/YqeY domain-containing protein [Pseudomonadota bacterium]